jgi:ribosomal protein S18 acetylase RimI-like enzyme
MTLSIIPYSNQYQTAVIDLWRQCNLIIPSNDPVEDIQKKIDFQPALFFIALLFNQVVGSIMVGYEGHRGWINYLAVLPMFQKQGYGKLLIIKAVTELRKLGCVKVNLQIRPDNHQVLGFYQHLGFKQEARINMSLKLL